MFHLNDGILLFSEEYVSLALVRKVLPEILHAKKDGAKWDPLFYLRQKLFPKNELLVK